MRGTRLSREELASTSVTVYVLCLADVQGRISRTLSTDELTRGFDGLSTVRALLARDIEPTVVAVSDPLDAAAVVDALAYSQFPGVVAGDRHWCGHRIDLVDSLLDPACVMAARVTARGDVR